MADKAFFAPLGSLHGFERGIIACSKQAKCDPLDIDRETVDNCGVVSRETVVRREAIRAALDMLDMMEKALRA